MPAVKEKVSLTLDVPADLMEQIRAAATEANCSIERVTEDLLLEGLDLRDQLMRSLEKARQSRKEYLERTGQRELTEDELWEQMRRIREEIANELYPD